MNLSCRLVYNNANMYKDKRYIFLFARTRECLKFSSQMCLPVNENNLLHRSRVMNIISSNCSAEKACRSRKRTISQGMLSRKDIPNGIWSCPRCHTGVVKSIYKSKGTFKG